MGLTRFGTPSIHKLKPDIPGMEGSVFNENFCLALARVVKLDVAIAVIHSVEGGHQQRDYLLAERYDRQRRPVGQRLCLHQEDFCQALGLPPEIKYQNKSGPTWRRPLPCCTTSHRSYW